MKRLLLLVVPLIVLCSACRKDSTNATADALVFGTYGGFCLNCTNIYRLDNSKLQKDSDSNITDFKTYTIKSITTLDAAKYDAVKHLLTEIPGGLLSGVNNNKVYGCPGCHDQAGYYIEVDEGGNKYRYSIDSDNTSDQPADIIAFKQKVTAALSQL